MNPHASHGRQWDRRASTRYKVRLPVIFHWNDGYERAECGFTHDIALDGALIRSRALPPVGADVRIEVLLPTKRSDREVRIQCQGTVTRVVNEDEIGSFGVQGGFNDDQILREAKK